MWIDLTGSTHLMGGEKATLLELASRVRELGHRVRVAIADGPRLAKAAASFAAERETVVPVGRGREMMLPLPMDALGLPPSTMTWLAKLGLLTVRDLAKLPKGEFCALGRAIERGARPGPRTRPSASAAVRTSSMSRRGDLLGRTGW